MLDQALKPLSCLVFCASLFSITCSLLVNSKRKPGVVPRSINSIASMCKGQVLKYRLLNIMIANASGWRSIWILIILSFLTQNLSAQDAKLDSLRRLYDDARRNPDAVSPQEQFEICMEIIRRFIYDHMSEESLHWIDSALALPGLDSTKVTRLLCNKGRILLDFNQSGLALEILAEAEEYGVRIRDKEELARVLTAQAVCYLEQGNYESAIPKYYKAMQTMRGTASKNLFIYYANIGFIHYRLENFDVALKYYAVADSLLNGHHSDLVINAALCKIALGRYSEGRKDLSNELGVEANRWKKNRQISGVLVALGIADLEEGKLRSARHHLRKAIETAIEGNELRFVATGYNLLAQAYLPDYPDSALRVLSISLQVAESNNLQHEQLAAFETFVEIFKLTGNSVMRSKFLDEGIRKKNQVFPSRLANLLSLQKAEEREKMLTKSVENQSMIILEKAKAVEVQSFIVSVNWILVTTLICLVIVLHLYQGQNKRIASILEAKLRERSTLLNSANLASHNTLESVSKKVEMTNEYINHLTRRVVMNRNIFIYSDKNYEGV